MRGTALTVAYTLVAAFYAFAFGLHVARELAAGRPRRYFILPGVIMFVLTAAVCAGFVRVFTSDSPGKFDIVLFTWASALQLLTLCVFQSRLSPKLRRPESGRSSCDRPMAHAVVIVGLVLMALMLFAIGISELTW